MYETHRHVPGGFVKSAPSFLGGTRMGCVTWSMSDAAVAFRRVDLMQARVERYPLPNPAFRPAPFAC